MYCCPCGVGQATCSESGLDIASNSCLEGDRVTDLCGTARLGGQVCPQEVWLHVQTVSCDGGRLDPAQDQDLSKRRHLCLRPANGAWLFGVDILRCNTNTNTTATTTNAIITTVYCMYLLDGVVESVCGTAVFLVCSRIPYGAKHTSLSVDTHGHNLSNT